MSINLRARYISPKTLIVLPLAVFEEINIQKQPNIRYRYAATEKLIRHYDTRFRQTIDFWRVGFISPNISIFIRQDTPQVAWQLGCITTINLIRNS